MRTRDLLAKVRKIELATRKAVDELIGGAYRSIFKGRGIEVSEVRGYVEGDDVRDIDWNVTARTGVAHVKQYVEERELTVILAVDLSASMNFGTTPVAKREKVAETAALLAFSAIRNNDKVGLLMFSDRKELHLPPRSGRLHVMRVVRELLGASPSGRGTNLAAALESLNRTQKKKAVVFLLSDFLDAGDFEKPLRLLSRKHDVVVFRIVDDFERELPVASALQLEDSETGRFFSWPGSKRAVRRYAEEREAAAERLRETCRKARADLIELGCSDDIVQRLMRFFRMRGARRERP